MTPITLLKNKVALIAYLLISTNILAQTSGELVPFSKAYPAESDSQTIRGDMKVIGNSILGISGNNDGVLETNFPYGPNDEYHGDSSNNRLTRAYIDIDSDEAFNTHFNEALSETEKFYSGPMNDFGSPLSPNNSDTGTFSSSAAELTLGSAESRVIKAFLYWGGIYPLETDANTLDPSVLLERPTCEGCEFYTDIKILAPNATEYVDIKYTNSGDTHDSLKSNVIFDGLGGRPHSFSETLDYRDQPYVCVADVTPLFENLQDNEQTINGLWTVGNVRATTGNKTNGSGGGWSLVVVYEDPLSSILKDIFIFNGYADIVPGDEPVTFNINGVETISFGPVTADIATIALEGDVGLTNDSLEINDTSNNWVPLDYPNSRGGADNFYDSSIETIDDTERFPSSSNTLGYDSDHFTINNGENELIGNNASEVDFRLVTGGDAFFTFVNAFAFERIQSDLTITQNAFDTAGNELTETDLLNLGDEINYEITITNTGNDDASNIRFFDTLPINTVLTSGGINLNGILVSTSNNLIINPASAIDSLTSLPYNTTEISFDIPNGSLDIGQTVEIRFSISLIDDCLDLQDICINQLTNVTEVNYFGEINNTEELTAQTTNTLTSENIDCEVIENIETVSICDETTTLELSGENGFLAYEWFYLEEIENLIEPQRVVLNADGSTISNFDQIITVSESGLYQVIAIADDCEFINRNTTFFFEVQLLDPNGPDCETLSTTANQLLNDQTNIYPSPVKDYLYITGEHLSSFEKVEVFNLKGEALITETNVIDDLSLNMSGFSTGVYVVIIEHPEGQIIKKIVKE